MADFTRAAITDDRYRYPGGRPLNDRDLYASRDPYEGRYGRDDRRPLRDEYGREYVGTIDQDPYRDARHPAHYDVYETRGSRGDVDRPRSDWVNDPLDRPDLKRNRDSLTSYGDYPSPKGGLAGIDYGHDLNRVPPTYSRSRAAIEESVTSEREYYSRTLPSTYTEVSRTKSGKKKWTPVCDMGETDKFWLIRCEIPGVRKDKLSVEIEGKDLIVRGKRIKELWNVDKLGTTTHSGTTTTTVKTSTSGHHTEEKKVEHTTASTTSGAAPSGTTAGHGAIVTEKKNPDGSVTTKISWVGKERGGRGKFKRRIRLPARVEQSAVQALYKDGILEILVRKPEGLEKRKREKTVAIH